MYKRQWCFAGKPKNLPSQQPLSLYLLVCLLVALCICVCLLHVTLGGQDPPGISALALMCLKQSSTCESAGNQLTAILGPDLQSLSECCPTVVVIALPICKSLSLLLAQRFQMLAVVTCGECFAWLREEILSWEHWRSDAGFCKYKTFELRTAERLYK